MFFHRQLSSVYFISVALSLACVATVANAGNKNEGKGNSKWRSLIGDQRSASSRTTTCWNNCRCSTVDNASDVNCAHADMESFPPQETDGDTIQLPVNVWTLDADWNRLSRLEVNLSSLFPGVITVSFNHNNISDIGPDVFAGLRSLRRLSLSGNMIQQLPARMLADTVSLEDLSLAGNPLDVVSVGTALSQLDNNKLRRLDISRTSVGQSAPLPETIFSHLLGLQHLVLRDITIENMTADYFSSLHDGLLSLDLTNTNINYVDEKAFSSLASKLTELILDNVIISTKDLENIFVGLRSESRKPTAAESGIENITTSSPPIIVHSPLETLSIRGVFIEDTIDSNINAHLFKKLSHSRLKTLRFDGNFFGHHFGGRIPARLFHPLRHLTSLSLNNCDIRSIPSDAFHGLHHLQTLTLQGNQLSCVRQSHCGFMTASHSPLNHLVTLDLSNNLLESGTSDNDDDVTGSGVGVRFPDDVFPQLVELDLTGNRLFSVSVGTFGNLHRLTKLKLSYNSRLTSIEPDSLTGLSSLTRLEVNGCLRLTHLKAGAFTGLVNLRVLSIRDSGLVHIHHSVLVHLEHLEELDLRNNRLGEQDNSIDHGGVTIRSPKSLRLIDLGGNKLLSVPTGLLSHTSRLRALYLDDNRLADCPNLRLMGPPMLPGSSSTNHEIMIDLSDNHITEPSSTCFGDRVTSLYLAGNPLYCGSCATASFITSVLKAADRRFILLDQDRVACSGPSPMAGENAFTCTALPGSWQCEWRDVVITVAIVALSSAVLLLTIAVARRQMMTSSCFSIRQRRCRLRNSFVPTASTVTISNGCYGDGSMGEVAIPPSMLLGAGLESTSRYSPLVEDDVRHDEPASAPSNGYKFWRSADDTDDRACSRLTVDQSGTGGELDGVMSASTDIEYPLIGGGGVRHDQPAAINDGDDGSQCVQSSLPSSATVRNARTNMANRTLLDNTGNRDDDVEDSL